MLNLERLSQKPSLFARVIGIKHESFLLLTYRIKELWTAKEIEIKNKRPRKRAIGGGRKYKLESMENKVLLILLFYRHNVTHELLGLIFDVHSSNITRLINKLLPIFELAADPSLKSCLENIKKHSEKISNPVKFFKKFPEVKEIVFDATEHRTFRPKDTAKRKELYSGKKKMFSRKTQICIDKNKRILDISKSFSGTVHDKKIFEIEDTINKMPSQSVGIGDLGYIGLNKDYPKANIILPFKRKKKEELSDVKRQFNRELAKDRIKVEHVLCRIKKFKVCSEIYRGSEKSYNQTFRNISALVNLNYCST